MQPTNDAYPPAAVAIGGVLLGVQFSAGAIAWPPELGRIGNKAAATLVGVAPYNDDSGEHRDESRIKGARREIRDLLYSANLAAATRHNPSRAKRPKSRRRRLHAQADRHS